MLRICYKIQKYLIIVKFLKIQILNVFDFHKLLIKLCKNVKIKLNYFQNKIKINKKLSSLILKDLFLNYLNINKYNCNKNYQVLKKN